MQRRAFNTPRLRCQTRPFAVDRLYLANARAYMGRMQRQDNTAERLKAAGLRPTAQRLALAHLLFDGSEKHISAESLFEEVIRAGTKVSLATVYNTLHQFKAVGLLREVAIEGDRSYYDTNTSNHFHLFDQGAGELTDLDPGQLKISGLPELPAGQEIDRIDVIIRLRPKS